MLDTNRYIYYDSHISNGAGRSGIIMKCHWCKKESGNQFFCKDCDKLLWAKKKDLDMAKHTIDTIAMLKERTKGNLDEEEAKFIEAILTDLRWRYVKAAE